MLDSSDAQSSPKRVWISIALLCAAMLFLPLLTWILVPSPGVFAAPPAPTRVAVVQPVAAPPVHEDFTPRPTKPKEAAPEGPVTGTVLDPEGKPVKGAFVGCDDRDKELATSTDAEGHFKLAPQASGCLAVSHHPDFTPSERMALSAGRDNTIRLRAAGGIEGVVVDEKGGPISPYLIAIESFMGSGESAETIPPTGQARSIQDAKGAFLLEGLAPGKYVLTASADGRPPARSAQIEVEAARITRHVRIVLTRGGTLTGKVIDAETRKPISGATVALDAATSTTANSISPGHSDEGGAFSIEGTPAGPFSIRVSSDKYRTRIISGLTTRGGAPLVQDVELTLRGDGGADNEMAGVGAILVPQARGVMVSWLVPNGPAQAAGLQVGDIISRIDGTDAQGMAMTDCVQRLRGPEGSRVAVVVAREGAGSVEILVTRKNIVR
ncbi:MAG: carboxypeptidase regulatory-like domain-containing protein [Byssovorax sp.]